MKFIFAWYDLWVGFFWAGKKFRLYFFPLPCIGCYINIWPKRCYVLMKRGAFYRPKAQGYTCRIEEAGRYTAEEAAEHVYPHDQPVTMHHISKFL